MVFVQIHRSGKQKSRCVAGLAATIQSVVKSNTALRGISCSGIWFRNAQARHCARVNVAASAMGLFDNTRLWLWAHARHDGAVRIAASFTFYAGKRLASGSQPCTSLGLRTSGNSLLCLRNVPCLQRPLSFQSVALGYRLLLPALLALIIIIEERAGGAGDLDATVAIGLVAVLADHRADSRRLQLDRVKRVGRGQLGVELGLGIAVEQRERTLRRRVPVAVRLRTEA